MTQATEMEPEVQAEQAEIEIRKDNTENILIDLADWLGSVSPEERAGMERAMQIIKANYNH